MAYNLWFVKRMILLIIVPVLILIVLSFLTTNVLEIQFFRAVAIIILSITFAYQGGAYIVDRMNILCGFFLVKLNYKKIEVKEE